MSFLSGAARAARHLPVLPLLATLGACGGDGTSSFLPPGPQTTAPPGNLVLYVAMAQGGRIDAYRLGTDGLLPAKPFDTVSVDNPRRLYVADGVLYASLFDRIVSFDIADDGSLPPTPSSSSFSTPEYLPFEIEVHDGILYVAAGGLGFVQSYELEPDGDIPTDPTASGNGEFPAEYVSLELDGDILYSGSRLSSIVDIFLLEQDGNIPEAAEFQDPQDAISLPDDLLIQDGVFYVTSSSDRSVRAYRIQNDGFLGGEEDSRTKSEEFYSDILIHDKTLYAAAYSAGRIDLYHVDDDGMLPEEAPFLRTNDDPAAFPARMLMNGGILYVAQAGLDRVDAYVLGIDGLPAAFPSTSTKPAAGDSFPVDLAMHELD